MGPPRHVDVWADDVVTLSLQYSTQWDSLAHAGAEFDADGDGVEEAVFYNGYRAGTDLVGPPPTRAATAAGTALRASPRTRAHGRDGRAGARRARRPRAPPRARLARRRPRDARRDHGGRQRRRGAGRHAALAHRLCHEGARVEPRARPRRDQSHVHLPRRARRVAARLDHRLADRGTRRRQLRRRGTRRRQAARGRHSLLPIHHLCLFKLGVPLGELWYLHELAAWLRGTIAAASCSPRRRCACRAWWVRRLRPSATV